VTESELCYTTPSVDLDPFQSEHEGYMGNWGNTVERWYHRAAVVLWPRERSFIIRAKTSARYAQFTSYRTTPARPRHQRTNILAGDHHRGAREHDRG